MPKEYGDRIKKVRPSLLEEGRERKYWDGPFNTADDLEGILMAKA